MKSLKELFVLTMTTITVLAVFLLSDLAIMGIVSGIVMIFSREVAMSVFKWGVAVMFGIELLFTIPAVIKSVKEGDKE